MATDIIDKLKGVGLLSDEPPDNIFVPTGSFALNKVISGDYLKGIPVGRITQFIGESSTAKTLFLTSILIEAQKLGYYTALVDSENAFSAEFARLLGLDPDKLAYSSKATLEDCFSTIETIIKQIREHDQETPIVIGYDSIAVSPLEKELDEEYVPSQILGAQRANFTGACFRKLNPILKENKVALVVINQFRSKVGVMFGSPDTQAAGGRALEFYLGVNMKTISNKTSDLIKDEGRTVGIKGRLVNKKNKVALPFRECEFELIFDKGLNPYCGLLAQLETDGVVTFGKGWYSFTGTEKSFRKTQFEEDLLNSDFEKFVELRKQLKLS